MPNVMIRRGDGGELQLYIPKRDLEEVIVKLELAGPERWGGEIELADGMRYYVEPLSTVPRLPVTLRARRL